MSAGLTYNKNQVDNSAGSIARDMLSVFNRAHEFQLWLVSTPDADLTALGYSAQDIANIKTAYNDAEQLYQIYIGQGTLPNAKDFRTFMQRLWGLPVA